MLDRMSLSFDLEHREAYSVVTVDGAPSLGQFLSFLHVIAVETGTWPMRRLLFDLQRVDTLASFMGETALGDEIARHLPHLERIACLVRAGRSGEDPIPWGTRVTAFTDEHGAIAWLTA